jgi:uncharacterized SAM-binding protein YcdF (DUF218 family)
MIVFVTLLKWFFFPPGIIALSLLAWGILLLRRRQKAVGAGLLLIATILYLSATPIAGKWAIGTLEGDLAVPSNPKGDVIVLLTAGLQPGTASGNLTVLPDESGFQRIMAAVDLQKRLDLPVIISGGPALFGQRSLSIAYGDFMMRLGVSRDRLIFENTSRNTYENAVQTAKLCRKRGFKRPIVATSGFHLKRALWCFKEADLPATGYPSGLLNHPVKPITFNDWVPKGYTRLQQAINEYAGMYGYRWFKGASPATPHLK